MTITIDRETWPDDVAVEAAARILALANVYAGYNAETKQRLSLESVKNYRAGARALLQAAIATAPDAGDGWLSIETAPKDGRHVMLAITDEQPGYVSEGYYEEDEDRGWFQSNSHWTDTFDGSLLPSHWRPLPAPPAIKRAAEG